MYNYKYSLASHELKVMVCILPYIEIFFHLFPNVASYICTRAQTTTPQLFIIIFNKIYCNNLLVKVDHTTGFLSFKCDMLYIFCDIFCFYINKFII